MAKRRERQTENPLKSDVIASISGSVRTPQSVSTDKQDGNTLTRVPKPKKWPQGNAKPIKTKFSPLEAEANDEFTSSLRLMMGSKVTESHITRALWSLARMAGEELDAIADKAPKMRRPSHGDKIGTADYEDAIAKFLLKALKRTKIEPYTTLGAQYCGHND